MKRLNFQNQIILGIVGLGIGHLLSAITKIRWFENLGWIFYGLLFLVHPVWPKQADSNPNMKTYIRLIGMVIILIGCFIRTGSSADPRLEKISDTLGIDLSKARIEVYEDDHGGFHGDGSTYAKLTFSEEVPVFSTAEHWHALPVSYNLEVLLYGVQEGNVSTGPFLIDRLIPGVENGYYFFLDRQNETYEDSLVLTGGSFNYTVAVYNVDTNIMYYCEYDT